MSGITRRKRTYMKWVEDEEGNYEKVEVSDTMYQWYSGGAVYRSPKEHILQRRKDRDKS